jgi:hypothetical protein
VQRAAAAASNTICDPRTLTARISSRVAEDDEREVDYELGLGDERVDVRLVQHVAAPVLHLAPAVRGGVEWPPGHADHSPDRL